MTEVHKIRRSRGQRFLRLLAATFDPRAWAHMVKIVNYYNYSHVLEVRKAKIDPNANISPTASFANGQNIEISAHATISAHCHLWAGPGQAQIIVGEYALLAPDVMLIAANYRYNDGAPITKQAMDERTIQIGPDAWIGRGATILAGSDIGAGAIVAAGATVSGNVSPYSIVSGNPAKLVGQRRNPASALSPVSQKSNLSATDGTGSRVPDPKVTEILHREIPDLTDAVLSAPIADSGIDSFALISLRIALEEGTGRRISDAEWMSCPRLADISTLPSLALNAPQDLVRRDDQIATPDTGTTSAPSPRPTQGTAHRTMELTMPRMALSGLSESWLFKELGDMHWEMICRFLGSASSEIKDEAGDRLYATFTRVSMKCPDGLASFRENTDLNVSSKLDRYGSGVYFGDHQVDNGSSRLEARTMSTFAKYGEHGKNTSLVKGSPILVNPDSIPSFQSQPEFGQTYREKRGKNRDECLFECTYDILPPHDINGVGLLYFAAYPTVIDLCLERAEGKGFLMGHTTTHKDIFYFANSDPGEQIVFRLHERGGTENTRTFVASLFRSSDMTRMAEAHISKKVL